MTPSPAFSSAWEQAAPAYVDAEKTTRHDFNIDSMDDAEQLRLALDILDRLHRKAQWRHEADMEVERAFPAEGHHPETCILCMRFSAEMSK